MVVEIIGGMVTGSLALISDAMHMLTDAMALLLALVAIRAGRKAADLLRTYGYARFEILARSSVHPLRRRWRRGNGRVGIGRRCRGRWRVAHGRNQRLGGWRVDGGRNRRGDRWGDRGCRYRSDHGKLLL